MQYAGSRQPVMKKDAMALVTGKPVFTQDVAPADCLVVKVLRSPHANANILSIKTDAAKKFRESKLCIPGKMYNPAFYHGRTDISGAKSL